MKASKKFLTLLVLSLAFTLGNAQHQIIPEKGFTPQIGIMVDMLEEIKDLVTEQVRELNQEQTDFLFDEKANSIGAIVMHMVATEAYIQTETLEGRRWTEEEAKFWSVAGGLGDESREKIKGKPIKYYLDLWDEVRKKTLAGLKTKDDAWFAANVDEGMNNHWAWFHILKHGANHRGQIALVKSRLPE
ncbi:MAG: DinB family protein [Flavobacteriaceae bacterium]